MEAAEAVAAADYETEDKGELAATVSRMISIQPARTTQALTASGNSQTMMPQQHGMTGKVAACTGHHPAASASGNRTTQPTLASQHQQTDMNRGRTIAN